MLPVIQGFADALIDVAVKAVEEKGRTISCKAGCGACCRQLVPISETEARRIADLVEEMPEPRRAAVRQRFADARRRLEEAGMRRQARPPRRLERRGIPRDRPRLLPPRHPVPVPRRGVVLDPPRPADHLPRVPGHVAGGELLSPDALQHRLGAARGQGVDALARFDEVPEGSRYIRWVPLILAPEWAAGHPEQKPPLPGPEWLNDLFTKLTGKEIRATAPPVGTGVMPEGMME